MSKKLALIISPFYPPSSQTASRRMQSFEQALVDSNYDVIVVSRDFSFEVNKHGRTRRLFNQKMNAVLNKTMGVISIETNRTFYTWALQKAKTIAGYRKVDLMITSFGPWSSHRVGLEVKKQFPHIQWIADFRDDPIYDRKKMMIPKIMSANMTRQVVNLADRVISVSEPITENLIEYSDGKQNEKFKTIYNGFGFSPLKDLKPIESDTVKIGYAGSLYSTRKPYHFFKALCELQEEGITNLEAHFWGNLDHISVPNSLRDKVCIYPSVPYQRIPEKLSLCDYQLLLLPDDQGIGVLSSKIFDYLAIDRPILAFVDPDDSAAELVRDTKSGVVVPFEDIENMKETLRKIAKHQPLNGSEPRDWEKVVFYSRKNQGQLLVNSVVR